MNSLRNHLFLCMSGVILLVILCRGRPLAAIEDSDCTYVHIMFNLERQPNSDRVTPILDAMDDDMEDALVKALEREVVAYCSEQFPYLNWISEPQSGVPPEQAWLHITMKAKKNLCWEVFLECATAIGNKRQVVSRAQVYDKYSFLPERNNDTQEQIRCEVFKKAREALVKLMPDGSDFIRHIPLARTIYVDDPGHRLIVPISADRLNAEPNSILLAEFITEVQAGSEVDAYAECRPSGQVRGEDHPLKGMQKCRVTVFDCPPGYYREWHDSIPDAIGKKTSDSIYVYMKDYKRKYDTFVYNP